MNLSDAEKKAVVSAEAQLPDDFVFGLDIGTRSIVGTVGYRQPHFVVVAQAAVQHETRAMLDGQIHDIGKVADTIRSVSDQLEQLTGKKLNNVCIAAAGRVLKTVEQEAEVTFTTETVVTTEYVYSLDMLAVEKAHETLRQSDNSGLKYYCVGYSVMRCGWIVCSRGTCRLTCRKSDVRANCCDQYCNTGTFSLVEYCIG